MRASLTKQWRFEAAHELPNHDGKCRRLHGHSYIVELGVSGVVKEPNGDADEGMVIDFGVLSRIWKDVLEPELDHQYLNQTIGQLTGPTTAENIAGFLLEAFMLHVPEPVQVDYVRVWETATGSATVTRYDDRRPS